MKSTPISIGSVVVDGVRQTLSHVLITIGSPEMRCGATQYHEVAYIDGDRVEVIDTHLSADAANTLFALLNRGAVSIDTRIQLQRNETRCFACGCSGCDEAPDCAI